MKRIWKLLRNHDERIYTIKKFSFVGTIRDISFVTQDVHRFPGCIDKEVITIKTVLPSLLFCYIKNAE